MINNRITATNRLIEKTKFYNDKVIDLYNKSNIKCVNKELT